MANAHGFRFDPMRWVAQTAGLVEARAQWAEPSEMLESAIVRALVLGQPVDGDQERIDAEIAETLAGQREDGGFGESARETAEAIARLIDLGHPPGSPEVQRAARLLTELAAGGGLRGHLIDDEGLPVVAMDMRIATALCVAGRTEAPELHEALRWFADHADAWIERGCPWTPALIMRMLWEGRAIVDTSAALTAALSWVRDGINAAGCLSYFDPWSFVGLAGQIDHPLCREILERQLPLILCAQEPDASWTTPRWWPTGESNETVLRALHRHGLLEELRARPPLPDGWRVVREIPAPRERVWGMAWDGESWWVCDDARGCAVAISPEDGAVLRRVKLPKGEPRGIGWWDGALTVALGRPGGDEPKRMVRIDPDSGDVLAQWPLDFLNHVGGVARIGDLTWVADAFFGWLFALDDAGEIARSHVSLAGPLPTLLAADGDALWHSDLWAPFLIKSGPGRDGQFVDCVEKPFSAEIHGFGFDGEHLWVVRGMPQRLCMIEEVAWDD